MVSLLIVKLSMFLGYANDTSFVKAWIILKQRETSELYHVLGFFWGRGR